MHANKREEITEVFAGDICAVGLRDTTTGDTLCDPAHPIVLESIEFPEPVIQIAIEPKTKADQDRLGESLAKLAREDPSFRVSVNRETSQTLISGMGELHLEIIVDRLLREFKVDANVGKPQVAYRETIRKPAEAEGRFVRQSGGHGQFGVVDLRIEPLEKGGGFEFVDATKGGSIPRNFIPSVEDGVKEAMETGVLAGYPMVDMRGVAARRQVSRGRLLGTGVQDCGFDGLSRGGRKGRPGAARAGDGSRSGDAAGIHGRGDRRPQLAPRQDSQDGEPRGRAGDRSARAAGHDVRLRDPAAFDDAGPGDLHDAVRRLRTGAAADIRRIDGAQRRQCRVAPRA